MTGGENAAAQAPASAEPVEWMRTTFRQKRRQPLNQCRRPGTLGTHGRNHWKTHSGRRRIRPSHRRRRTTRPYGRPNHASQQTRPTPTASEARGRRSALRQAINGGAELHARYIAERLARHAEVEVLTTCATDYVTWRNELPAGVEQVNGVPVRRFPRQARARSARRSAADPQRVFEQPHSIADELEWLDAEGPTSPALVDSHRAARGEYDFCIFFSYRYYHAYHGARAAGRRAILVPTAERDAAIGLSIFRPIFRGVARSCTTRPKSAR